MNEHEKKEHHKFFHTRGPKNASEKKLVNQKPMKEVGYTKDPDEENGFYGHYLPSHFKKTDIIRTNGR